jgi:hypothetical protein
VRAEIFSTEDVIHHLAKVVKVFIGDLDEDAAGLREEFLREQQAVAEVS